MKVSKEKKMILSAILLFLGFIIILIIWRLFTIPKNLVGPIVAGLATVLASIMSILITKYLERKQALEEQHRNIKIPMYKEFMTLWFDVLMRKGGKLRRKYLKEMHKLHANITTWSSEGFIKELGQWRKIAISGENPQDSLFQFERALIEMRKELGHNDEHIEKGDLLRIFINNVDDVLNKELS